MLSETSRLESTCGAGAQMPARESVFYLNTKRLRMGHLIELAS